MRFELAYRPPYDWPRALDFLAARAVEGVESVEAGVWRRTVRWPIGGDGDGDELRGWIALQPCPDRSCAVLACSDALSPVVDALVQRVRAVLDFDCDSAALERAYRGRAPYVAGLRMIGGFDGFELAVRAVLGQQISVARARKLAGRLVETFGESLDDELPPGAPLRLFPTAQSLAAGGDGGASVDRIAALGVIGMRARAIVALASACASGALRLEPGAPVAPTLETLQAIPGIGDWTAQYIAMRALCWRDAFPAGDLVLRRALGAATPAQARAAVERWQPWRAYAVIGIWSGAGVAGRLDPIGKPPG